MSALLQDIRYAVRTLRRSAGLTAVIIVSLAIGIGANTAIFSVVNALLLKPLPYPDPDRLVVMWLRSPGINIPQDWPSPGQYVDVKNENRSFDEMSISQGRVGNAARAPRAGTRRGAADIVEPVSSCWARDRCTAGCSAVEDEAPGKPPVVMLSHGFWKRAFGGDPGIVGKTITTENFGVAGRRATRRTSSKSSACSGRSSC